MKKRNLGGWTVLRIFGVVVILCFMTSYAMSAEKYPSKPINLVVGYAPGGSTDLSARVFGKAVEKILKQPVIVINKPGAASSIQMQYVKTSLPDGYTLGAITTGPLLSGLLQGLPYRTFEDFTHLCQYGEWLHGISVRVDSPWKNLHEFVDYAKKNPGKIKYSSMEKTTHIGLLAAQFGILNKIPWAPVVYPGDAPGAVACLGGHVDASVVNVVGWAPFVRAGKLRTLAVLESKFKEFPDIPMASDLGYKYSSNFRGYVGVLGPKGLPPEITATLIDTFRKAVQDPEFQKGMDTLMLPVAYKEGEEWINFLKGYEREGHVIIDQIGLKK